VIIQWVRLRVSDLNEISTERRFGWSIGKRLTNSEERCCESRQIIGGEEFAELANHRRLCGANALEKRSRSGR